MANLLGLIAAWIVTTVIAFWLGSKKGRALGRESQQNHIDSLFYATTRVQFGGALKIFYDALVGHTTEREMIERLEARIERIEQGEERNG